MVLEISLSNCFINVEYRLRFVLKISAISNCRCAGEWLHIFLSVFLALIECLCILALVLF